MRPQGLCCLLQRHRSDAFIELLLAAARSLCPVIRRFLSMGLNRVWLKAGRTAYQCAPALQHAPCTACVALHAAHAQHLRCQGCRVTGRQTLRMLAVWPA